MPGKPKGFLTCYVCQKEFGSKSMSFHEPQCLQKWKNENNKLPPSQRSSTPKRPTDGTYDNIKNVTQHVRREGTIVISQRPRTATLEQPKILDINYVHRVDMTSHCKRSVRSRTFYLNQPTPNLKVPSINSVKLTEPGHSGQRQMLPNKESLDSNGKVSMERYNNNNNKSGTSEKRKSPKNFVNSSFKTNGPTKPRFPVLPKSPPEPCQSCGNGANRERLHSHPRKSLAVTVRKDKLESSRISRNGNGSAIRNVMLMTWKRNRDSDRFNELDEEVDENEQNNHQDVDIKGLRASRAPLFKQCSVCGRQIGSNSLQFHEPKCLENWQQKGAKHTSKEEEEEVEVVVAEYEDMHREREEGREQNRLRLQEPHSLKLLVQCLKCKHRFHQDRLVAHERVCCREMSPTEESKAVSPMANHTNNTPVKARISFVLCYICGREFGSKSIAIHEPQCLRKWHIENSKLSKKHRRAEPQKPEMVLNDDGTLDMDASMDAVWKSHLEQLVPCSKCQRTFIPDRLAVHERVCVGNQTLTPYNWITL